MNTRMASDEVTDGIAAIEMHRQGTEKESGLAASCSEALKKLNDLLAQEKESLAQNGPDTIYAINVEAVENEIRRVQAMTGNRGKGQGSKNGRGRERDRQAQRPEKHHNSPRNRGRRGMGRGGRGMGRRGNKGAAEGR